MKPRYRSWILCVLSFAFFAATAQHQNSTPQNDSATLRRLEHNWLKAEFALDTAFLSTIIDETFMGISANGITSKQQELTDMYGSIAQRIKNGVRIDSFRLENVAIQLYGATAVVTFVVHTYGKNKQETLERKSRFYDVWVKRSGKWKAVASQVMRGLPVETKAYNSLKKRSSLWNTAYNNRDSVAFYELLDSAAVIVSANGASIGKEACKGICRKLYVARPDITWRNDATAIDINEQWGVASETGNWTESWTEKGDAEKSTIRGTYALMWKQKNEVWYITSALFTPLSCTGSYCSKK